MVTLKSFKTTARQALRCVVLHEISAGMTKLQQDGYGLLKQIKSTRPRKRQRGLHQEGTSSITTSGQSNRHHPQYEGRYILDTPKSVGQALKKHLHDNNIQAFPQDFPATSTRAI